MSVIAEAVEAPSMDAVHRAVERHNEAHEEITLLESTITTLRNDRDELVARGRDDEATVDRLTKLDARLALGESRLVKARTAATEAEKSLSEAITATTLRCITWGLERHAESERRFRDVVAPFFEGGQRNRFFTGGLNASKEQASVMRWFGLTDEFAKNRQFRQRVDQAKDSSLPLARRISILEQFFLGQPELR